MRLVGHGVHVVTVNDYLAKRDASGWARSTSFSGSLWASSFTTLDDGERRAAYAADITYGTITNSAFDYLRDNMKFELKRTAARVATTTPSWTKVDSILIDEAPPR